MHCCCQSSICISAVSVEFIDHQTLSSLIRIRPSSSFLFNNYLERASKIITTKKREYLPKTLGDIRKHSNIFYVWCRLAEGGATRTPQRRQIKLQELLTHLSSNRERHLQRLLKLLNTT